MSLKDADPSFFVVDNHWCKTNMLYFGGGRKDGMQNSKKGNKICMLGC